MNQETATQDQLGRTRELMEESSRLREWLGRLDAHQSDRPRHIIERVRTDYVTRLDRLTDELRGHRSSVEESLAEAKTALERRSEELEGHRDRLEELRLRYEIGEIEDGEWEAQRPDLERDVETAESAHSEAEAQVDQLSALVDELSDEVEEDQSAGAPTARSEEGEAQADTAAVPESTHAVAADAGVDPLDDILGSAAGGAEAAGEQVDEADAADEELPEGAPAAEAAPAAPAGEAETGEDSIDAAFSEWEMDEDEDEAPEPVVSEDAGLADAMLDEAAQQEEEEDDGLGFLEDLDRAIASSLDRPDTAARAPASEASDEATQRLPCKECGAVNDPRAWYCEVCGMELS